MRGFVVGTAFLVLAGMANAQEETGSELPTRYPETGIPILNCEPSAPAPENTCLMRMRPGYEMQSISDNLEGANFSLVKRGLTGYPANIGFSATLILVDLSPGPGGGRRTTFETERELIADIVNGLPSGELVSVYGFNENLQRLTPFSDDRAATIAAIAGLELQGSNTRIGTFVSDGISILATEENVLMRNLIVISDGQEEGQVDLSNVIEQAIDAEVAVSVAGMFWRPVGSGETGLGMDYLRLLADGTSGVAAQAILRRGDSATSSIARFIESYADAIDASRLILPIGEPQSGEITLQIGEPALGAPGEFNSRDAVVRYVPTVAAAIAVEEEDAEEAKEGGQSMLFGYPQTYVFAAAAAAALLMLLILILAMRSRGWATDERAEDEAGLDFEDETPVKPMAAASPTVAVARASAYLIFGDTQRRVGLSGDKNSVGRSSTNDVVVEVEGISRLHAQIFRNRDGGYSVTDMDSLNGTFVNGKKVSGTQPVRLGDKLTFGTVEALLVSA